MITICRKHLKIRNADLKMTVWALEQVGWYFGGVFLAKKHAVALKKVLEETPLNATVWLRPTEEFMILNVRKEQK